MTRQKTVKNHSDVTKCPKILNSLLQLRQWKLAKSSQVRSWYHQMLINYQNNHQLIFCWWINRLINKLSQLWTLVWRTLCLKHEQLSLLTGETTDRFSHKLHLALRHHPCFHASSSSSAPTSGAETSPTRVTSCVGVGPGPRVARWDHSVTQPTHDLEWLAVCGSTFVLKGKLQMTACLREFTQHADLT